MNALKVLNLAICIIMQKMAVPFMHEPVSFMAIQWNLSNQDTLK